MLTPKSAKTLVTFLVARKSVTMLRLSRTTGAATAKKGRATTGAGKWVDSSAALWRGGHDADGLMCKVCHWGNFMDADGDFRKSDVKNEENSRKIKSLKPVRPLHHLKSKRLIPFSQGNTVIFAVSPSPPPMGFMPPCCRPILNRTKFGRHDCAHTRIK